MEYASRPPEGRIVWNWTHTNTQHPSMQSISHPLCPSEQCFKTPVPIFSSPSSSRHVVSSSNPTSSNLISSPLVHSHPHPLSRLGSPLQTSRSRSCLPDACVKIALFSPAALPTSPLAPRPLRWCGGRATAMSRVAANLIIGSAWTNFCMSRFITDRPCRLLPGGNLAGESLGSWISGSRGATTLYMVVADYLLQQQRRRTRERRVPK